MPRVRSFQLLNHTIKVTYPHHLEDEDGDHIRGDCEPDQSLLRACIKDRDGQKIPDAILEHSRWHEQVHLMFFHANRMDLYEDETLVDTIAGYLAQYEATARRR